MMTLGLRASNKDFPLYISNILFFSQYPVISKLVVAVISVSIYLLLDDYSSPLPIGIYTVFYLNS